ncbi:MAG: hypothetical protein ACRCX2_30790, partial [Paraclostridium sp.]
MILNKFSIEDVRIAVNKKAMLNGVNKYNYIQENIYKVNVMENKEFQTVFVDFYKVKEARNPGLIECIFSILETNKHNRNITIEEIVDIMYDATDKIQISFASKVLATMNDELGVVDMYVMNNLGFERKYGIRNKDYIIAQYYQLNKILNEILDSDI